MITSLVFAATLVFHPNAQQFDTAVRVAAGEARGVKDDMAIAGVCHVMINRLLIGQWGSYVDKVVTSHRQFSAYNDDDPNKRVTFAPSYKRTKSYRRVRSICRTTFKGRLDGYFTDITNGADHYYSGSKVPYWAKGLTPSATIGPFRFFNIRRRTHAERSLETRVHAEKDPIARLIQESEKGRCLEVANAIRC